jgi:ankyrin repeat protein
MEKLLLPILAAAILLGCAKQKPAIDIWTAAGTGNIEAIKQHLAGGTDLNAQEPSGGATPLLAAALYGQTEAARLLIEKNAKLETKNNDGATPLLVAVFFCQPETLKLLLEKGADVHAKNNRSQTSLDTVAGPWSPELESAYVYLAGMLQMKLDLEKIKRVRPELADLLRKHGG